MNEDLFVYTGAAGDRRRNELRMAVFVNIETLDLSCIAIIQMGDTLHPWNTISDSAILKAAQEEGFEYVGEL